MRIRTHRAHRVRTRLLSHHVAEAAYDAGLVLNLNMNRIIRVHRATIWHWSLRPSSSGASSLPGDPAHLARGLQNLLAAASRTVHGVVHHARLIQLTVRLPVEGVAALVVLPVNTLVRAAGPFEVLALGAVSIAVARPLVRDNASANHPESAAVFALSRHLLDVLIILVLPRLTAW